MPAVSSFTSEKRKAPLLYDRELVEKYVQFKHKRAKVDEGGVIEWVSGSFGSHVSYLYPMSVLNGEGARSEFTGITFAGKGQNLDTGCKVVHNAPKTSSYVNTRSISGTAGSAPSEAPLSYPRRQRAANLLSPASP